MPNKTVFTIENDSSTSTAIFVEPECVEVTLKPGEGVTVSDTYEKAPTVIRMSDDESGNMAISVWPGDGQVTVTKDGHDVLGAK